MDRPDDRLPAALLDLGLVPTDQPLPLVLDQVARLAAEVLGGDTAVSVTVVGAEGGSTVGASSPVAAELDAVQYRTGDGPCLQAAATGQVLVVEDTERDRRWPRLTSAAAAAGRRGVISIPLPSRIVTASLNLYLHSTVVPGGALRARAELFARHAAVPVGNAHLYARTVEQTGNLQAALRSRAVIDQAKGILMERYRLTERQAFDALVRVSNETNTKVRDIASRLVDTGEFPPG